LTKLTEGLARVLLLSMKIALEVVLEVAWEVVLEVPWEAVSPSHL
jgi:hypothetical protein